MQIIFYLVWLCLLVVLQPTLGRGIEIWGIAPNLFLCFVVLAGFFRGKMEGAISGCIFGLMYDILIGRMIGVNSLIYLYVGLGAGILSEHFFGGGKRVTASIATMVATLLSAVIYYFARRVVHGDIGFLVAFFRISVPEAIYNLVICFLLSFPVVGTMKLLRIKRIH